MKAILRETSRTMEHPAETGIIIGDHRIINQIEIEIPFIINAQNYDEAYSEIKNLFLKGTLLAAQTRTGFYDNLIIADLPHEEDPQMFDAITLALHLKEVLFVPSPAVFAPADPQNTDTVATGQQMPVTTPAPVPPATFNGQAWFGASGSY